MTRIRVPATDRGPAAYVELAADGTVTNEEGRVLGTVGRGSYRYSPPAAGHSGRIARFHMEVGEWTARAPDGRTYEGGIFPGHYRKNTRKAALAFLVAADANPPGRIVGNLHPEYFYWAREDVQWGLR